MDDLDWIRRGLEKPGKTQTGLAKALGRSPSMITTLLKGGRLLKVREVGKIAEYLGVEPPTPEPQEERPEIRSAFIEGEIAAGVWRERNMEFEKIPVSVVVDERWPSDAVYVLRISGKSINRQARDGDLVLCLRAHAAPRPVRAGDWVVAERSRPDGTYETTVKRVEGTRRNGFVLMPDSDDPHHQEPIPLGEHDGESVEVRAFVLEFIKRATNF